MGLYSCRQEWESNTADSMFDTPSASVFIEQSLQSNTRYTQCDRHDCLYPNLSLSLSLPGAGPRGAAHRRPGVAASGAGEREEAVPPAIRAIPYTLALKGPPVFPTNYLPRSDATSVIVECVLFR